MASRVPRETLLARRGERTVVTGCRRTSRNQLEKGFRYGSVHTRARRLMVLLQAGLEPASPGDMIVVQGDLDVEAALGLQERLDRVLTERAPALAVDLRGCLAVHDGSLESLIDATGRVARSGIPLAIISGRPQVRQALREAGLDHSIALCWTREAAIAALAAHGGPR